VKSCNITMAAPWRSSSVVYRTLQFLATWLWSWR